MFHHQTFQHAAAGSLLVLAMGRTALAESVIKNPGDHPDYSVELEPHLVLPQWEYEVPFADLGIGPGLRVTIPFFENGPIESINNNMGISFGVDWALFLDDDCDDGRWHPRDRRWDPRWRGGDCNGHSWLFPVAMQWNFFLTDVISVFGEPGLALQYRRWEWECDAPECGGDWSRDWDDVDLRFVFWGGARFLFSDTVGLTARAGLPYLSVGLTILL